MRTEIESFVGSMNALSTALRDIIDCEQQKRQSLLAREIPQVEQIMQKQQALNMKLQNCEKKRLDAQNAAGLEGKTAAQIVETLEGEERSQFVLAFTDMNQLVTELKELNRVTMDIANSELRFLRATEPGGAYKADGTRQSGLREGSAILENI